MTSHGGGWCCGARDTRIILLVLLLDGVGFHVHDLLYLNVLDSRGRDREREWSSTGDLHSTRFALCAREQHLPRVGQSELRIIARESGAHAARQRLRNSVACHVSAFERAVLKFDTIESAICGDATVIRRDLRLTKMSMTVGVDCKKNEIMMTKIAAASRLGSVCTCHPLMQSNKRIAKQINRRIAALPNWKQRL